MIMIYNVISVVFFEGIEKILEIFEDLGVICFFFLQIVEFYRVMFIVNVVDFYIKRVFFV